MGNVGEGKNGMRGSQNASLANANLAQVSALGLHALVIAPATCLMSSRSDVDWCGLPNVNVLSLRMCSP